MIKSNIITQMRVWIVIYLDTADFADSYVRADFVKKVYTLLTLELGFTLGMIALGLYTGMASWLVSIYDEVMCFCTVGSIGYTKTEYCDCGFYSAPYPTWLFYVSFFVSIIL
jgi:FtsH-binding integral membrane protein